MTLTYYNDYYLNYARFETFDPTEALQDSEKWSISISDSFFFDIGLLKERDSFAPEAPLVGKSYGMRHYGQILSLENFPGEVIFANN